MNTFVDYIARLGIIRVLSVPVAMAVLMYLLYRLAAPPEDLGEIEAEDRR